MYLIDTDIVIYALKGMPAVVKSLEDHAADPKAISVVTYGELVYGASKSARTVENMARARRMAELLPVIEVSRAIMETFGGLKSELEARGKMIDDFDLVIASTALVLNYKLVTNNERHFRHVPGLVIDNWSKA